MMNRVKVLTAVACLLAAVLWPAVAQDSGTPSVQDVRIDMTARRYTFTPNIVRVKAGSPVELHVVSTDVKHGLAIPALKINEILEPHKEVVITFTPTRAGKYPFFCSVFCGPGHADMHGELIVE
jgi:cytochrome c oxidase subunit 2